jgi:hypothetical protein
MATLSGEVQRVTFENEETGFRVLKLTPSSPLAGAPDAAANSGEEPLFGSARAAAARRAAAGWSPGGAPSSIVVVGIFAPVAPGSMVRVTGNYVDDPRHGRQFRAD